MPLPFAGDYNTLSSSGYMNEFYFNIIIKAIKEIGRQSEFCRDEHWIHLQSIVFAILLSPIKKDISKYML